MLKILEDFDHIVLSTVGSREFKELFPGRVSYLPPAVDAIKFCPVPDKPSRFIDVLSIGRRSEATHSALLKLATEDVFFYVFDTLRDLGAYDIDEHRFLFASMAKRSRYFVVNPGKIDRPGETGGQSEFGQRYFEGLAPGTILIGECPTKIFFWPDAVIHVPFGSKDIGATIRELDKDPERQATIRRRNMTEALRRHDWVYRWESVLAIAGLQPVQALHERKQRLDNLATMIEVEKQL